MRHTAQQFTSRDFARFDHVVAMDDENLRNLLAIAPHAVAAAKVTMLLSYDDRSDPGAGVPDPYYGGPDGFAHVFDLVERACRGLLAELPRWDRRSPRPSPTRSERCPRAFARSPGAISTRHSGSSCPMGVVCS
jgi:hypothetical protein